MQVITVCTFPIAPSRTSLLACLLIGIERCWEPMTRFIAWRKGASKDYLGVAHGNAPDKAKAQYLTGLVQVRYKMLKSAVETFQKAIETGDAAKVAFLSLAAFFPVVLNTFEGIRGVPADLIEVARVLRFNRRQTWTKIILPAASPSISRNQIDAGRSRKPRDSLRNLVSLRFMAERSSSRNSGRSFGKQMTSTSERIPSSSSSDGVMVRPSSIMCVTRMRKTEL